MASQADIIQRVAEGLGLVPIEQAPEAQDVTRILGTYVEVYAMLKEKGLAVWAASANPPDALVPYFILLILQKLAGIHYSVPDSRLQRINLEAGPNGMTALLKLAEMTVALYEPIEQDCDY